MATLVTEAGSTLVLFALKREAAPFRRAVRGRAGVRVAVCGVGREAVRNQLPRLLAETPFTLAIMAGFCGGLRAGLPVGDVVAPREVLSSNGRIWPCRTFVGSWGRGVTTTRIVADPADKRHLADYCDADIVDMESADAAEVCAGAAVAFAAVRAVTDDVNTTLSPTLVNMIGGGQVSTWKAVRTLVRHPSLLSEFKQLARNSKLAAANLASVLLQILDAADKPGTAITRLSQFIRLPNSPASPAPRSPS